MNIYLIVEGPVGEKRLYSSWIPFVNNQLSIVPHVSNVVSNNVVIVSGGGYPSYFDVIRDGIDDVRTNRIIDRLVVAIDSEEMTYLDKWNEVNDFIVRQRSGINYKIIVQHFCLEAWALGNRVIFQRSPSDPTLKAYISHFNVLSSDPELLPDYPPSSFNRAQFASAYLKKLVNEKYRGLTYTKSNPSVLLHKKFFDRVKARRMTTSHIQSFNDFLTAFV